MQHLVCHSSHLCVKVHWSVVRLLLFSWPRPTHWSVTCVQELIFLCMHGQTTCVTYSKKCRVGAAEMSETRHYRVSSGYNFLGQIILKAKWYAHELILTLGHRQTHLICSISHKPNRIEGL